MPLNITRLSTHPLTFMRPGVGYDRIPYDWDGTDRVLLDKFEAWRDAHDDLKVVSISGPQRITIPRSGGAAETFSVELVVIWEDA